MKLYYYDSPLGIIIIEYDNDALTELYFKN